MLAYLGSADPKADYFSMIGRQHADPNKRKAINMTPKPNRPYCRHKEFSKMPQFLRDTPCIRISSKYEGSFNRMKGPEAGHLGVTKERWKSAKDFRTVTGQGALNTQDTAYISNYVVRDPSEPPQMY